MAYHKIDNDSINSITNALDIFHIPPTNVAVSSAKVFEILTSNPLTSTPFHFKLHSSQNYIDLAHCYLFTEFRIRKQNDQGVLTDIVDADNVAPIQMIGSTFINNLRILINNREIYNSNSLQAFKSYLSTELSYGPSAKSSHLNAAGYYGDSEAGQESGSGFNMRKKLFANSKVVQCIAKIDADIFNQPLYLVNHCEVDMEIMPHESDFLLIAPAAGTTKYQLEVISCKLYVKKVDLMDGLALDMSRKLESTIARYAIRKTMMKSLFISPGRYEFNGNLFMDQIPRKITLGLIANDDYVGKIRRSPFNFQPFAVHELSITANGRSYPQAPYDLDYDNGKAIRAFLDMNEAVGYANTAEGNGITYEQFIKNHCIYVFNLTNSGEDSPNLFDLIKSGTTAINIKFRNPVPASGIVLLVMGEADSLIMIDKNRMIASDTTI